MKDLIGQHDASGCQANLKKAEMQINQLESQISAAAQTEADDLKKPIDDLAAILKNMQGVAESAVKRSHEDIQLSSGFNIKPGYQADRGPRNADPKFPNGEWHEHGE